MPGQATWIPPFLPPVRFVSQSNHICGSSQHHVCVCSSLRPLSQDLILRIESGDQKVLGSKWPSALLVATGRDIFKLIDESVAQAARLSGTAKPLTAKHLPDSLDYFGWCTWDAFYSTVSAEVLLPFPFACHLLPA
jgi:hypothetical protein